MSYDGDEEYGYYLHSGDDYYLDLDDQRQHDDDWSLLPEVEDIPMDEEEGEYG